MCSKYEELLRSVCLSTLHDTEKHLHALRCELLERTDIAELLIAEGWVACAGELTHPFEQMIESLELERNSFISQFKKGPLAIPVLEKTFSEIMAYNKRAFEAQATCKADRPIARKAEEEEIRTDISGLTVSLMRYRDRFQNRTLAAPETINRFILDLEKQPPLHSCRSFYELLSLRSALSALSMRARIILSTH